MFQRRVIHGEDARVGRVGWYSGLGGKGVQCVTKVVVWLAHRSLAC